MTTTNRLLPVRRLVIIDVLISLLGGVMYYQVVSSDPSNPRANFWRVIRAGIPAYTSTPAQGHTILIQNGGEN